jgi:predicted transcriptional regulator of viral defense system
MNTNRIIIYPKDVQNITGRSERYSRMLIRQIKDKLNKEEHQLVTIDEFCQFIGIKPEQVRPFLVG